MILVPLILGSAAMAGIAIVVLLDRAGVLPPPGGGSGGPSAFLEGVSQGAVIGVLVAMGAWILAWMVLLVVGLGILSV